VTFGASVIGFAIAQAGPTRASDAGTAAGWGIFFGAVLAGFGLVLMYRSANPGLGNNSSASAQP